jgi:hypothetical protein
LKLPWHGVEESDVGWKLGCGIDLEMDAKDAGKIRSRSSTIVTLRLFLFSGLRTNLSINLLTIH